MHPAGWFTQWRLRRARAKYPLPLDEWHQLVRSIPCLQNLSAVEMAHLRERVVRLLDRKTLNGVQGLRLTRHMQMQIAAQACLPILNLDLSYYDGWQEVIVYPDSFLVRHPVHDDIGLVSQSERILSGEAWEQGPVILAWSDIQHDLEQHEPGSNVIIHEFAHKLDMLNGRANGMPPLHRDMRPQAWTSALSTAYQALQDQLEHHQRARINPYGATSPAEFFAVLSEYFFTAPELLVDECPDVYQQLTQFYRQDPLHRLHPEKAGHDPRP